MRFRSFTFVTAFAYAAMLAYVSPLCADQPEQDRLEFFEKEIRPLLSERCFRCHGEQKSKSGLRLDSRAGILKGGDTGPAAVPGKPEQSPLVQAIRHQNGLEMPPKEPLKPKQIENIAKWIQSGMSWPEGDLSQSSPNLNSDSPFTEEQRKFWSFQPVKRVAPPKVKRGSWPQSAIDQFILSALEKRNLQPAKQADKHALLRRATFDLTGLPPTPQEIEAFLADQSPDAFATVIDRLLSSAHYGERWGRHWLDVVRYTDSFDARIITGDLNTMDVTEAYRYRDWVVSAFNEDLPYDQFIVHQIAGDLIPPASPGGINVAGILATGMLAIGNWGGGDADKEKLLTDIADDQVDVVSRAFLGITMACARCHDHKFDPFTTEDYYGLAGIFFSTHILADPGPKTNGPPMLRIPLVPAAEAERQKRALERIAYLEKEIKKASVGKPSKGFAGASAQEPGLDALRAELEKLTKTTITPAPFANGAQEGGCPQSPHAGISDVHVHIRGRYDRLGSLVPRRFPAILTGDSDPPSLQGSGRMELARWIASPDNPLTARVMVNRIWQHHFGEGIVRTPGNFGKLGEAPTNPELLDYLARLFVQSGWSIKAMHRAIMLSTVYQQSCIPESDTLRADPENRLFGRMNRRRLEAEELRDSLLAVAGRLDATMGGRATRDFNMPRRSLYLMTIRSDRSTFRELFDAADPTAINDKRVVSTVAPQALFLLNHPFTLAQAKTLVARLLDDSSSDDSARIAKLYSLLFARSPTKGEIAIGQAYLARVGGESGSRQKKADAAWLQYCQVLVCANEFIYVD
jgi:hypothetical protein